MLLGHHGGVSLLAPRHTRSPEDTEPLGLQMLAWDTSSSAWSLTSTSACCQWPSTGKGPQAAAISRWAGLPYLPVTYLWEGSACSLLPYFDGDALVREDTFLRVAVDLYLQLLRLFVAGDTSALPTLANGGQELQGQAGARGGPPSDRWQVVWGLGPVTAPPGTHVPP